MTGPLNDESVARKPPAAAPAGGASDVHPVREGWLSRRQDLAKVLLALFVLGVALLMPVKLYHDRVAMQFQYGRLWLGEGTETTRQAETIRIESEAYDVRVVNINGIGVVSL